MYLDYPNLGYSRGVLSTPAIKAAKLLSDLDVRGNEIKHAVLVEAAITSAREIVMPHAAGMAFFEAETGRLLSNPAMNMSEETGSVNIFNLNASSIHAEVANVSGTVVAKTFVLTRQPLTKALADAGDCCCIS